MKTFVSVFLLLLTAFNTVFSQNRKLDSLLAIIEDPKEDTGTVNAYRFLIGLVNRQDPQKAIQYGKQGIALAKKLNFYNGLSGCYINTSAAYTAASRPDSTLLYLDTAILYARKVHDPNRLALIFLNRADANMYLRNLKQSLKDCDSGLVYAAQSGNKDRLGRIYQTIGSVYYTQDNFLQSTVYYEKALNLYREIGNQQMSAIVLNNMGNVHKHTSNSSKAIAYFKQAIQIADSLQDEKNLSMYYGNLSDAYLSANDLKNAEINADKAMEFAQKLNNDLQIGIAYGHYGEIYLAQKKYREAIDASLKAYQLAEESEDLTWQQTTAEILSDAYSHTGDFANAFRYEKISKQLNDSLIRQQFDEDIAAMQTEFRVEEKDKEIQLLNLDAEVKRTELQKQRVILFTIAALLILTLAGIFLLISRSRLRNRMKELELRNRIAADLHDEVGSSLSSIHVLSHMANQRKEHTSFSQTLEKISGNAKDTMERMSDIVWAIHPENDSLEQLVIRMKEFAADILEPLDLRYNFHVDVDVSRQRLNINQRRDLYLVFKEAVNNAAKYSGCSNVDIRLSHRSGNLEMEIADDGTGFNEQSISAGNGLRNMKQRAKQMGGNLHLSSSDGNGTKVLLTVPS